MRLIVFNSEKEISQDEASSSNSKSGTVLFHIIDFSLFYFSLEKGLVTLEDHAILNLTVFIQVEPCAVCALPLLIAIVQHPLIRFISYGRLHL